MYINFQFVDKDLFLKSEFQKEILYIVLIYLSFKLFIINIVNEIFFVCEKFFLITKISCCKLVYFNSKMCKKIRQEEKLDYIIFKLCF